MLIHGFQSTIFIIGDIAMPNSRESLNFRNVAKTQEHGLQIFWGHHISQCDMMCAACRAVGTLAETCP